MKTIALRENSHIADVMELSTLECLKSFHLGLGWESGGGGMFKEGHSKGLNVLC